VPSKIAVLTYLILACTRPLAAAAEEPPRSPPAAPDSLPHYALDSPVIVSAAKLPVSARSLAGSVALLDGDRLRELPGSTLPEVLSEGAGLNSFDLAGNGRGASAEARGFSSQGETSHLRYLVDGIPYPDLADDRALWNLFDADLIERVEILTSGSSAMHGNAAFTGAVNVVPLTPRSTPAYRARLGAGSHGGLDASGSFAWSRGPLAGVVAGYGQRLDGWRDHSAWRGGTLYGALEIPQHDERRLRLSLIHHRS